MLVDHVIKSSSLWWGSDKRTGQLNDDIRKIMKARSKNILVGVRERTAMLCVRALRPRYFLFSQCLNSMCAHSRLGRVECAAGVGVYAFVYTAFLC